MESVSDNSQLPAVTGVSLSIHELKSGLSDDRKREITALLNPAAIAYLAQALTEEQEETEVTHE